MGRPEKPVDPEAGPAQRLAHDLRALRRAAGNPSYRAMAARAGLSASTLSHAAAGERLPSLAAVQGYVLACGADPEEWETRWKSAEADIAGAEPPEQQGPAPYRGLARFETGDSALFFGRDRLADELLQLVCDHRFAVVLGPSGSGKSSLLRAGLIPRLREDIARRQRPATVRILTPGARPAATHGQLLAPEEGQPESWVVVDQFEEVFSQCRDEAERARFIDLLLAARESDSRLRVVVAVRADFYARCAEHPALADALRGSGLLMGPMTADHLREAVIRPAAQVGLLVERALTARIVEEVLDEPGALPLLSHAMLETWRRRRGRVLTLAAYEATGGVRGAVASIAEEVYSRLPEAQTPIARQLLLRMIEPGQDSADIRRPLGWAELDEWASPHARAVVERLADARLVTVEIDGVHLVHEALITAWPRLRGWIDEDRDRLRQHRRLSEAARAWQESDHDPGALYRGAHLARAEELFADSTVSQALGTAEWVFLLASFLARDKERQAASRMARRTRLFITVLTMSLAAALVSVFAAWRLQVDNERQHTDAEARRVAAEADALRTTDPRTAMLLGVAAWRISPVLESRRAMLGSLAQPLLDTFTDPTPEKRPARFLADSGRTLISIDGRNWRAWDVVTHRRTESGRLPDAQVVDVSADARVLALRTGEGIRLWDTATGRWSGGSHTRPVTSTSFGFGGSGRSYLVAGTDTERVEVRSVSDGRLLFETRAAGWTYAAASTDDRFLAACRSGGLLQVWDMARRHRLTGAWEKAGAICDEHSMPVFAGGADRLATVSDSEIRVWDIGSGRQVAQLRDPGVKCIAFGEHGDFLATAGGAELRVWRLSSPDAPVFRHPLLNEQVGDLAWDPDRPVVRYRDGSNVRSLDLATAVTPAWHSEPLSEVRLSPDGRVLATARRSGTRYGFQLRDTRDGHLLRSLPSLPLPASPGRRPVAPQETLPLMAFSPDSTALAYGVSASEGESAHQRIAVWDLGRDRTRVTLDLAPAEPAPGLLSVALGPGGAILYAARRAGDDEVWDTVRQRRETVLAGPASPHLAVRPDGQLLVGDNLSVRLPSKGATGRDWAQGGRIGALLFSPDGSRLMAGDVNGRVSMWDGELRRRTSVLRNVFPPPLDDTAEGVSALALSPDGGTLAVASDRGTLQLWDIPTLQPLGGPLTTPGERISTLAFSRDGTTLFSGSLHVPLQRYTIDAAQALTLVCARAATDLTRTQWDTYIPHAPYRSVCYRHGGVPPQQ